MLTEVSPNKTELYGRIIAQIGLFAGLSYFIYVLTFPKGIHHLHEQRNRDWCFGLLFLALNIGFFLKLYYMPFWVIIDDELKILEIKYLMLPTKNIGLHDITGYSSTTIKLRSTNCFGMFIHLHDGKKILLSDLNFYDYTPVELFLDKLNVKKLGEEEF